MALTNGAQRGVGFAVIASLGRLIAFIPMIVVSALGMGLILFRLWRGLYRDQTCWGGLSNLSGCQNFKVVIQGRRQHG